MPKEGFLIDVDGKDHIPRRTSMMLMPLFSEPRVLIANALKTTSKVAVHLANDVPSIVHNTWRTIRKAYVVDELKYLLTKWIVQSPTRH